MKELIKKAACFLAIHKWLYGSDIACNTYKWCDHCNEDYKWNPLTHKWEKYIN
jgi:hypothetical protein